MTLLSLFAVVPILGAFLFGSRSAGRPVSGDTGPGRAIALLCLVAATVVTGVLAVDVMSPPPAIVEGTLDNGGGTLTIPKTDKAITLVAEVEFPDHTVSAQGTYVLDVAKDGVVVQTIDGHAEQHFERRRVGRRGHTQVLIAHVDHHHDVEVDASQGLTVSLHDVEGQIKRSMVVKVRPSPPPLSVVMGILGSLTFIVAISQRKRGPAFFGATGAVAGLATFAFMIRMASGEPSALWVMVISPLALVVASLLAGLLGKVMGIPAARPKLGALPIPSIMR